MTDLAEKLLREDRKMSRITINGVSLDPTAEVHELDFAGLTSPDASSSDYILVQTTAPLTPDQKDELAGLSVEVHEYVSENTYLCVYKDTDLSGLRALPYVTWANTYMRGFKVAPALRSQSPDAARLIVPTGVTNAHSNKPHKVDIVFHGDADLSAGELRTAVATAARVDPETLPASGNKVRLTVQERYLDDLADLDAVRVIQSVPERSLRNNVARSIINAGVVVNGTGYQGEGQVVAVADTGFDTGSTTAPHPAFTGRVAKLYGLGRPDRADDFDGHGTHVCGSVLGDGTSASMGGSIQGTAPLARLVVQSLVDASGSFTGIPDDLVDLFDPPYTQDGARVHTNSWGAVDPGLPYDQSAREIDEFVWNHPDMVICWAAGNSGTDHDGDGVVDPASVGSEAAAKNCITVGASESQRPDIGLTYGKIRPDDFPKSPISGDPMANDADGMAAFSSRGPTQEGRIKPDVVAPGTSILSTHSRIAPTPTIFGTSTDPDYFFDSGTSMATPLVAGCAAVLRETLIANGVSSPPASLIKALLINGATELVGQYSPSEAGGSPNNNSGFGLVNLLGSVILPDSAPTAGFGEGGPLQEGAEDTFTIAIPDQPASGTTLNVTLVWSDPPGDLLQNDLDLTVVAADETERHGNMGTAPGFDRVNNVEQVLWTHMPAGVASITIRAHRITRFPQAYAYAWRIS
jgi:serine protease AprX